ncbi:hypothetical protein CW702_00835 [Candidatus Bathyarchaeota archaeon]|nr:MAG: hypothetical protein CW702_00835 [Candidatus Bathyarchaeota archaeon]
MKAPFNEIDLIDRFVEYDENLNGGKGFSESSDSGVLGWFESSLLRSYFILFEVTGEKWWLDKITWHFDKIASKMANIGGDKYPSWHTCTYSTAEILTRKLHNRGRAEILPYKALSESISLDRTMYPTVKGDGWSGIDVPLLERVRRERDATKIKDSEYIIEFVRKDRFIVRDLSNFRIVYESTFESGEKIEFVPGVAVTIIGKPEVGDKFRVECRAVRPIWYVVHQGMILYPLALFMEVATKDKSLSREYSGKIREYINLIEENIVPKIERYWIDVNKESGAYRFTENSSERFPNRILPHNQYLAMARAFLVLNEVTSKRYYLIRALKMGRYFKDNLHLVDGAYIWHYWDYYEEGRFHHGFIEDIGHGSIDVGFAIECCRRGVLFNVHELRRFCKTFTDKIWNGSLSKPRLSRRVDGSGGESAHIRDWINLSQWDSKIFFICYGVFKGRDEPVFYIPYILEGWRRLLEGLKGSPTYNG